MEPRPSYSLPLAWTGALAMWAPLPPAPPPAFALPPKGAAAARQPGVWLLGEGHAALALEAGAGAAAPPLLTATLRGPPSGGGARRLVAAPLAPGCFSFAALCPAHASGGGGGGEAGAGARVVVLSLDRGAATLAFRFDSAAAGLECAATLAALHAGRAARAPPPPPRSQQGQAWLQLPTLPAGGTGAAAPTSAQQQQQEEAHMLEAIHAYLCDPAFAAYVDRVEALWVALEAEAEGQAAAAAAEGRQRRR